MDDDEKDQFYGCGCQRYLAVGLMMPFLCAAALLGLILVLVLLPGKFLSFIENSKD